MQPERYLKHTSDSDHLGEAVIYIMTIGRRYYIGSAKKFRRRISHHLSELKAGNHANDIVQKAWNKYRSVAFEVIEVVSGKPTEQRLRHIEQHYLDLCYGDELCMNIAPSAFMIVAANTRRVVINGVTYESVTVASDAIGEKRAEMSQWLSGRKALPKRLQFTEFRYEDKPEQYRRAYSTRGKALILNGKQHESVAAAARAIGVPAYRIAPWISGREILPKKHGIYELRYEGTKQRPLRETRTPYRKTYIVDGVPELRKDFVKRLGVSDSMASSFVSGKCPIPRSYGITSVYIPGQPDRSRLSSRRRVILNGVEYCGVTEAANSIGVNRAQFDKWLNGKAKPSAKYNIHSLHYA